MRRFKTLSGCFASASTSAVPSKLTRRPGDLKQLNDSVWEYFKPQPDSDGVPKMEILFFHGAQLSPGTEAFWKTWLSRDETVVWPTAWLAQKFPEARMLFVSYDSSIQRFSGQKDMYQTVENLMHDIIWSSTCSAGQKCPMIFVGHCFGGIIIKEFLIRCSAYPATRDPENLGVRKLRVFLQHCKAVFYYSTPNTGSGLMDALGYQDFILGNVNKSIVHFLKVLSKDTTRINDMFSNLRRTQQWETRGIGETLETNLKHSTKIMVVPDASAMQDMDRIYWAPDADHFNVSRAKDNSSCSIFTQLYDLVGDYYHIASSSLGADYKFKSALPISNDKPLKLRYSSSADVTKMTTSPLPFGQDKNYVPIVCTFDEVRKALEGEHEKHVVTICGEPGLGKTSLAKYIALHYWPHHTPHGSGERSSAFFPDGVFFVPCGQGAVRRIKQLQKQLLQILGGELEAVPADIPEERDGDHVAIPTFRRRFQVKLRDLKALIILDDVWERPVLEELILSPDEAGSVKYLLTSQIIDIWPHAYATSILMKKPTLQEGRAILLKYTEGLSAETGFPENIEATVDSIIRLLDSHPLTLANFGLGFRNHEGQDPEAWRRIYNSLKYELPVTESYGPLIYGREYPFALDMSMTRIISSLQKPEQDLIFLVSGLSNSGVPETVVQYLYKWARIGNMSRFRYCINYLQNRSLVNVYSYEDDGRSYSKVVIHKLRALSIISQFPREVSIMMGRTLQPLIDLYSYRTAQRTAIGSGHCDSVDVNDGLFNAAMLAMYTNERHLGDVRMEMPSSVDFDVDDMLKTAGQQVYSLEYMVMLLRFDSSGERWEQEAALCAKKIIAKFICRHELDDESVACLIQLPETRLGVLRFLYEILCNGYWWRPFFEDNRVFSATHSVIVRSLSVLVHDDATSHDILLLYLIDVLFTDYIGLLDMEDDDTIVNIGERLIKLAVGENVEDSFEWVRIQRFPCSSSRAFRVLEEKSPHLCKAMLTLFIQETIRREWFSGQPSRNNVDNWGLLEHLYSICYNPGLTYYNLGEPFVTLVWLSEWPENRGALSASPEIMTSILSTLVHSGEMVLPYDEDITERYFWCVLFVRHLVLSPEIRQKILSMYPQVLEALEQLEKNYVWPLKKGRGIFKQDGRIFAVSHAIGLLHSTAVHIKISEYKPHISDERFEHIIRGRLQACYDMKMYEEFLDITEEDIFPRRWKERFLVEIITAKVMLKWYPSALVDAHANILLLDQSPFPEVVRLGRALGLRGMVLLSGNNLEQALTDFEKGLHLLNANGSGIVLRDIYHILKYRGFTKYLMGDVAGAKEDATEAQQLELRSLVWDIPSAHCNIFGYEQSNYDRSLFSQPLTYLGFNFTF